MPVYVFVTQLSAPSVVFAINVFSDLDYEFVKTMLVFQVILQKLYFSTGDGCTVFDCYSKTRQGLNCSINL